jgi:hypothetical protein
LKMGMVINLEFNLKPCAVTAPSPLEIVGVRLIDD